MTACKKRFVIKVDVPFGEGPQGPPGPEGPPGPSIDLPLSSDDVDYNGTSLTDVLDSLLYIPLVISSFTASPRIYERGIVLTSIALAWGYNKTIQFQSITGTNVVPPVLGLGERNKIVSLNNITIDTVITLTADDVTSDGNAAKVSNLTIQFQDKIYWGVVGLGTVNSAFILALSNSELKATREKDFTLSTSTNQYIWFACPVDMGDPSFKTNGFNGGLSLEAQISFTNASGFAKQYNVYRTLNDNLGSTFVEVD